MCSSPSRGGRYSKHRAGISNKEAIQQRSNRMATITRTSDIIDHQVRNERVQARRLLWAGPLTALAATFGTVLVREIGVWVGAIPASLPILQVSSVAYST